MMPMAEPDGAKQRPCVARVQELPAAPWFLDKLLNMTSAHGWGQNTRFKQKPDPFWCPLTIPGVPAGPP